jgi:phage terminase large subunit GpA-like protein
MTTHAEQAVDRATGLVAPPEAITVTEWAERERHLSPESSAASGPFRAISYQIEPMNAFGDEDVREIALMFSTQVGKSTIEENIIAYIMAHSPAPTLLIQHRDIDAENFAKERLGPMVRDSPVLADLVEPTAGADTMVHRRFPGGFLAIVASGSPANLSARPIKYVIADEIDKYGPSAGNEGDPISLARKRMATFHDSKLVMAGSPTVEGESRIAAAYEASDQRKFHVPCPHCNHYQTLKWSQVKFSKSGSDAERAATARYACESCSAEWNDLQRHKAVESGHWRAERPFGGTAGFWLSELYSPWKSLPSIVADFLVKRKAGPSQLQVFVNTSLAEVWSAPGERPSHMNLFVRREQYPTGECPRGVLLLTCGVDVQIDRLEYEVVGWGRLRQNWSIEYGVIPGSPNDRSASGPWARLDELLYKQWPTESGSRLSIWSMGIDSGNQPTPIYDYVRRHAQPIASQAGIRCGAYATTFASKGSPANDKLISNTSSVDVARRERGGVIVYSIGTFYAKSELYACLRLEPTIDANGEPTYPPGYCHFPDYSATYFAGLTSETRVVRASGAIEWVKSSSVRNEPLDCRVIAMGAAEICGVSRFREYDWMRLEGRLEVVNKVPAGTPAPAANPGAAGGPSTIPSDSTQRALYYLQHPEQRPGGQRPIRGRFI